MNINHLYVSDSVKSCIRYVCCVGMLYYLLSTSIICMSLVLSPQPARECIGEVKGFLLIYSGNFMVQAHMNRMGEVRVNMGINPENFQWHLFPGGEFSTPEAILVRSDEGIGGMSRTLHRLLLNHVIRPSPWTDNSICNCNPPIVLNTWEAKYFDINHHSVMELARLVSVFIY